MMIASTANKRVKDTAALARKPRYRSETGLFVVEGPRMFAEIPRDRVVQVYATERFLRDNEAGGILDGIRQVDTVTEEVLKAMSDTQTPQGVLAVVKQRRYTLADILSQPGPALLMILETIQDPGNLGTILRSGEGAGVTGVLMDGHTADLYSPKVIRSTMGSIFRVPHLRTPDLQGTVTAVKKAGVRLAAAHLQGSVEYDAEAYTGPAGFLIGNEAAGLSGQIAAMADVRVRIPMSGKVESLNAAVAASVLMYEAARQRRHAALAAPAVSRLGASAVSRPGGRL